MCLCVISATCNKKIKVIKFTTLLFLYGGVVTDLAGHSDTLFHFAYLLWCLIKNTFLTYSKPVLFGHIYSYFFFFFYETYWCYFYQEDNKSYHILMLYILCTVQKSICITIFTCTKYVHQMLANLQHVSSHHKRHHLGVLSVANAMPSKCPLHSE